MHEVMEDTRERFDAIYRQHAATVLAYARRRASPELAQDAAAETFVAAWRRLAELPADPLPWLLAATRKTLANRRRSEARQRRVSERLAAISARIDFGHEITDPAVRAAFTQLSPADREALALLAWEELTPTQAAAAFGCSAPAFRVRAHRARKRFARALEQESNRASVEAKVKEAS